MTKMNAAMAPTTVIEMLLAQIYPFRLLANAKEAMTETEGEETAQVMWPTFLQFLLFLSK